MGWWYKCWIYTSYMTNPNGCCLFSCLRKHKAITDKVRQNAEERALVVTYFTPIHWLLAVAQGHRLNHQFSDCFLGNFFILIWNTSRLVTFFLFHFKSGETNILENVVALTVHILKSNCSQTTQLLWPVNNDLHITINRVLQADLYPILDNK